MEDFTITNKIVACHHLVIFFSYLGILDGVASHAMVVIGDQIWLYGGLSYSKGPLDMLARYGHPLAGYLPLSCKLNRWPHATIDSLGQGNNVPSSSSSSFIHNYSNYNSHNSKYKI